MRAVVTRVTSASVLIEGRDKAEIGKGFLILLGIGSEDTEKEAEKLADKISGLRVFEDESGKMNLSTQDVDGSFLVISQFTLYGNCRRGRRPDFMAAAKPETAVPLYELFIKEIEKRGIPVKTGVFGAYMKVSSVNDGPVTLYLDTDSL